MLSTLNRDESDGMTETTNSLLSKLYLTNALLDKPQALAMIPAKKSSLPYCPHEKRSVFHVKERFSAFTCLLATAVLTAAVTAASSFIFSVVEQVSPKTNVFSMEFFHSVEQHNTAKCVLV